MAIALVCLGCSLPKDPIQGDAVSTGPSAGDADEADDAPGDDTADDPSAPSDGMQAALDAGVATGRMDSGQGDAPTVDAGLIDSGMEPPLESSPVMPPPDPPDTFGLVCDGVTCPGVPADSEQCCTSMADVDGRNARAPDRCGVLRPAAGGCLELEQPGVPDDGCPTLMPPGASAPEPGCCTVDGACGTLDTVEGIGCHVDGALHEQPCGDEDIDMGISCEPTGVFAMLAEVDVAWGGQSGGLYEITEDGRGKVRVWLRLAIDDSDADGNFQGELLPCGAVMPAFYSSILCESYLPVFPDAIWDGGQVPTVPLTGAYQCESPGCILTIDSVTGLVGIALDDTDGPWPAPDAPLDVQCNAGEGLDCYEDHDDDGHPGVTVLLPSQGSAPGSGSCDDGFDYRGAPLNANPLAILDGVRRTDRLHLGVRLRIGGAGRLADDCLGVSGTGTADFVQSRAASCMVEPGTRNPFGQRAGEDTPCRSSEADFLNENLPIYDILALGQDPRASLDLEDTSPGEGTTFEAVRLADQGANVSCAEVRAALQ